MGKPTLGSYRIPHSWLLFLLTGLILGGVLATSASSRWGDPLGALFGQFGVVTVLTGVVTVFFLGYRAVVGHLSLLNTQRSLEHSQRAEVAVRFQKGMEMLANEHESTRIGGLYLLRDVITALPDVYWASVSDSLFPFIRKNCAPLMHDFQIYMTMLDDGEDPEEIEAWLDTTPPDVVIALKILGRGWPELKEATEQYNLSGRHLRGLVLANIELTDLSLSNVSLDGAILQSVHLKNCTLQGCQLTVRATNAKFEECNLSSSSIFTKIMPYGPANTEFIRCQVENAEFDGAVFTEVSFSFTDITNAVIKHPKFVTN